MLSINNEIINEIRNKCDIIEVISKYIPLTKRGKNYFGVCPFHDDHSPSMSVSFEKQIYTCFSCGASGNVFTFVSEYEHVSFIEAVKLLGEQLGYTFNQSFAKKEVNNSDELKMYQLATKFYQNNINTLLGRNAIKYLKDREINQEIIKKFGIGLSIQGHSLTELLQKKSYKLEQLISIGLTNDNSNDVFINRIMFPIWDLFGNVVAFSGRIYNTKDSSKYINSKETKIFKKGNILYNYHNAKEHLKKNDQIIVMEGFMDVIRASTIGINNCIATMGTAVTKEQAQLIKKMTNQVILCFDGDKAGEDATISCLNLLESIDVIPKIIRLEDDMDPDDYIRKKGVTAFQNKIDNAISILDFKMAIIKKSKNFNNMKDISLYIDEVIKELVKLEDEILIELNLKKISVEFNIEYQTLNDKYQKIKLNKEKNKLQSTKIEIKSKLCQTKYDIAQKNLIYYMLKSEEVIHIVENKVSYMPNDDLRYLANEIIYYFHNYGKIELADFITYINNREELKQALNEIITLNYPEDYSIEEVDDYVKIINGYSIERKLKKLNSEIKNEDDPLKQAEILKEKISIKGVNKND